MALIRAQEAVRINPRDPMARGYLCEAVYYRKVPEETERESLDAAREQREELLAQTRASDLQAFAHADVPFERLVEVLNPARSTARHPLFQVGLSFQNMTRASLELPGLTIAPVDVNSPLAKTDLQLTIFDGTTADGRPAEIHAEFTFATDLFDVVTVDGFVERFVRVLESVVADSSVVVGDIGVLGEVERSVVVSGWNDTVRVLDSGVGVGVGSGGVTLASLFVDRVGVSSDAVAVALTHGFTMKTTL